MHLLQKMGWRPGEGLGKEKNGSLQPLLLEVKLDKRGLVADEEVGHISYHSHSTILFSFTSTCDNFLDIPKSTTKTTTSEKESVIDSNGQTKYGEQASGLVT